MHSVQGVLRKKFRRLQGFRQKRMSIWLCNATKLFPHNFVWSFVTIKENKKGTGIHCHFKKKVSFQTMTSYLSSNGVRVLRVYYA